MQSDQTNLVSLTFDILDIFYAKLLELSTALNNLESLFQGNKILNPKNKLMSSGVISEDLQTSYQKLKTIILNSFEKSQHSNAKSTSLSQKKNFRYETFRENLKENIVEDSVIKTSLNNVKEKFEISVSNQSCSNKLGFKLKSNKMEIPEGTMSPVRGANYKQKSKQGSMFENPDFECILAENKPNRSQTTSNFHCSLDSSRLRYLDFNCGYKEECDPRFIDIINLNQQKKTVNETENNLDISDNMTENMIETNSNNNLCAKEEKEIIKETLKKVYKCEFDKLTDSKTFKRESSLYIVNSKWLRLWMDYVNNADTEIKESQLKSGPISRKPSIMNNSEIIKNPNKPQKNENSSFPELKENLLEHYDYVALPKKLFKIFKSWYGVDFEILRYLKPDPTQFNKMILDLYPRKIIH